MLLMPGSMLLLPLTARALRTPRTVLPSTLFTVSTSPNGLGVGGLSLVAACKDLSPQSSNDPFESAEHNQDLKRDPERPNRNQRAESRAIQEAKEQQDWMLVPIIPHVQKAEVK